jgi:cystathionine beta-lyase family protein involved in aluminum resistance
MLDLGFERNIKEIVAVIKYKNRQTVMFRCQCVGLFLFRELRSC